MLPTFGRSWIHFEPVERFDVLAAAQISLVRHSATGKTSAEHVAHAITIAILRHWRSRLATRFQLAQVDGILRRGRAREAHRGAVSDDQRANTGGFPHGKRWPLFKRECACRLASAFQSSGAFQTLSSSFWIRIGSCLAGEGRMFSGFGGFGLSTLIIENKKCTRTRAPMHYFLWLCSLH